MRLSRSRLRRMILQEMKKTINERFSTVDMGTELKAIKAVSNNSDELYDLADALASQFKVKFPRPKSDVATNALHFQRGTKPTDMYADGDRRLLYVMMELQDKGMALPLSEIILNGIEKQLSGMSGGGGAALIKNLSDRSMSSLAYFVNGNKQNDFLRKKSPIFDAVADFNFPEA